jgi:hypothetical protein
MSAHPSFGFTALGYTIGTARGARHFAAFFHAFIIKKLHFAKVFLFSLFEVIIWKRF